jgi:hypothetical protein
MFKEHTPPEMKRDYASITDIMDRRREIMVAIFSAMETASPMRVISVLTSYFPLESLERALPTLTGGEASMRAVEDYPEGSEDRRLEANRQLHKALGHMPKNMIIDIIASWISVKQLDENLDRICSRLSAGD